MKKLTLAAAIAAVVLSPVAAAGNGFSVSVGPVSVVTDVESGNLPTVESLAGLTGGSTAVDVDNNTQLGLVFGYQYNDNIGFELLAATPFSHTAKATVGGAHLVDIADTKQLPPTLLAQYYYGDANSEFRPFVGLGINYTWFFDTNASESLVNTLDALAPNLGFTTQNTSVKLSNSWGLAAQVGFDWKVNDSWSVRGTYYSIDIDTDAEVRLDGVGAVETVEIALDPGVYFLGASYKF